MSCDPANLVKWKVSPHRGISILDSLVAKGLYSLLRRLLLAIVSSISDSRFDLNCDLIFVS